MSRSSQSNKILKSIETAEKRLAEIRSRMIPRITKRKESVRKSIERAKKYPYHYENIRKHSLKAKEELDRAYDDNMSIADNITVAQHSLYRAIQ